MKKINFLKWIFAVMLCFSFTFTSAKDVYLTSTKVNTKDGLTVSTVVEDPFAPYLTSIPIINQIISEENSGSGNSAITTRKFTFSSRGGVNMVYAIISYPQKTGKYPAVMFLHGGGSYADTMSTRVKTYAQQGYVTIAIDMPGLCGSVNSPYTTGPFKLRDGEGPRLDVSGGPKNSTLVDAIVAGIEAFNYMRSNEKVDVSNMGITGFSWGGYAATMLSGLLGDKVKAAYSVFGSGYYDKGTVWKSLIESMSIADRTIWLTYLDAGRRVSNMKANYFLECETNDTYFWPEAVEATLKAVPGVSNHAYGPNRNHLQIPSGGTMQLLFFNYYLKGVGQRFVSVEIPKTEFLSDGSRKLTIKVDMQTGVAMDSVNLYYSEKSADWQHRNWKMLSTQQLTIGTYSVVIPADIINKNIDYFVYAKDNRSVVTGSYMFNTIP